MKKMTSRERRAEERRILAEMDEAMKAQDSQTQKTEEEGTTPAKTVKRTKTQDNGIMPSTLHCKRCKTVMENGVCPACGFKIYMPMDEEKRKKIKMALTVVGFVVFIIIFVAIQFKNA